MGERTRSPLPLPAGHPPRAWGPPEFQPSVNPPLHARRGLSIIATGAALGRGRCYKITRRSRRQVRAPWTATSPAEQSPRHRAPWRGPYCAKSFAGKNKPPSPPPAGLFSVAVGEPIYATGQSYAWTQFSSRALPGQLQSPCPGAVFILDPEILSPPAARQGRPRTLRRPGRQTGMFFRSYIRVLASRCAHLA